MLYVVGFIKLKFGICISKCCYCAVAAFFGVSKLVCETDFCPEIVSSSFFGAYIDGDESERADLYIYICTDSGSWNKKRLEDLLRWLSNLFLGFSEGFCWCGQKNGKRLWMKGRKGGSPFYFWSGLLFIIITQAKRTWGNLYYRGW